MMNPIVHVVSESVNLIQAFLKDSKGYGFVANFTNAEGTYGIYKFSNGEYSPVSAVPTGYNVYKLESEYGYALKHLGEISKPKVPLIKINGYTPVFDDTTEIVTYGCATIGYQQFVNIYECLAEKSYKGQSVGVEGVMIGKGYFKVHEIEKIYTYIMAVRGRK